MARKYNYDKIALDILTCKTNKEVCKKNRISDATLYRLKQTDELNEALDRVKENTFGEAMKKAQVYCREAMDILVEIATDETNNKGHRLTAACKIMEFGKSMNELETVKKQMDIYKKKVEQLEELVNERNEKY